MANDKLFISKRVVHNDEIKPAGILVSQYGKIKEIISGDDFEKYKNDSVQVIDVGSHVLMAGVVDSHVHVNEPGRTAWEGFETATKAAAAGGVTTIVDMPLNSNPPTTTLENLKIKFNATEGKLYVDVAFWGGVVPGNQDELLPMIDSGVVGFKCFMGPSGIEEFPHVTENDIEKSLKILQGTNSVLAFHAEIDEDVDISNDAPNKYSTYLKSRPPKMEENAVKVVTDLCGKYSARCHIVHVSAASVLPHIKEAKKNGTKLTAESCHHYLSLIAENIPDNQTQYKCAPPIRESTNRETLWNGLKNEILDMVVSDHSPCTPDLKFIDVESEDSGNFIKAWGGISSLQFGLSLFWTEAKNRGFNIWDINKYMSVNPAKLTGLHNRKGQIKEGYDADFVIWEPEETFEIKTEMIQHKNKVTPYLGKSLYGKVYRTVVRGETVYENGEHSKPKGIMLKK